MAASESPKKKSPWMNLIAGGCAGLVESSICHPLDTIKTRMQLRRQTTSVEKAVTKMRHSLMEPVERFKHSLQEPRSEIRAVGLHEPGLRLAQPIQPSHVAKIQVNPSNVGIVQAPLGPIGTARRIINREGFLALYKGLTAVYTGIVPKMAIRFVSFEQYQEWGKKMAGGPSTTVTFTAGLFSGLTEAISATDNSVASLKPSDF